MEKRTVMASESQMRQALEIVLRELAQAILHALPEHPKERPSSSSAGSESGGVLHAGDGRLLLSVAEAAATLGVSRSRLYHMMYAGEIRTIQLGRSRRVPMSVMQEFVATKLRESS
jgi:excisionase family DNA binding protein